MHINSSEQGLFLSFVSTILPTVQANGRLAIISLNKWKSAHMCIVTHDYQLQYRVWLSPLSLLQSLLLWKVRYDSFLKGASSMKETYPGQTGQKRSHKSAGLPHCPSPRGRGHSQHRSTSLKEIGQEGFTRTPRHLQQKAAARKGKSILATWQKNMVSAFWKAPATAP